jgi:hypothetical protein
MPSCVTSTVFSAADGEPAIRDLKSARTMVVAKDRGRMITGALGLARRSLVLETSILTMQLVVVGGCFVEVVWRNPVKGRSSEGTD